jgi:Gamma tubulin complex component N-terminal
MVEGVVNDRFGEFFVEDTESAAEETGAAQAQKNIWTERYKLNPVMIPNGLITFELAKKILLTGKAVNFIRRCCKEQDWMLDPAIYQKLPASFEALLSPE